MSLAGKPIRLSVLGITLFVLFFALVGCGVEGERLIALASFQQIKVEPRGAIFMKMVRAYYDHSSAVVPPNHEQIAAFTNRLNEGNISDDERRALISLLSIQAVDESEAEPSAEIIQSWTDLQIWNRLSNKSRQAFFQVY